MSLQGTDAYGDDDPTLRGHAKRDVPDHVRLRITECADPDILRHWLARAVTASSAEAVFEDE
ncbi:hypothetical protein [Streptomyces sp. NPDC046988]|uniref:hypothetical protein n=1 Tax=Streptomyces sp. NPDC046988 TaxID=3154922 RepID=UPI0033C48FBB